MHLKNENWVENSEHIYYCKQSYYYLYRACGCVLGPGYLLLACITTDDILNVFGY